jgi:hypothetical protein
MEANASEPLITRRKECETIPKRVMSDGTRISSGENSLLPEWYPADRGREHGAGGETEA